MNYSSCKMKLLSVLVITQNNKFSITKHINISMYLYICVLYTILVLQQMLLGETRVLIFLTKKSEVRRESL